jgi:hypothetical protein
VTASAAGSDTQIQYNSSGALAGSANFTYTSSGLFLVSSTGFYGLSAESTGSNSSYYPTVRLKRSATPSTSIETNTYGKFQFWGKSYNGTDTYRAEIVTTGTTVSSVPTSVIPQLKLNSYLSYVSDVDPWVSFRLTGVGSYGIDEGAFLWAGLDSGINQTNWLLLTKSKLEPQIDNNFALGSSSLRWSVVYAVTGTINTSDRNEKQNIEELSAAEQRAAVRIKGLIRKFRFKDSVVEKGDGARIHVGVVAQDVQDAFTAEGLDASRYGLFCSDTYKVLNGKPVQTNQLGEYPEGAVDHTRLGVRYDELLAFVISAV